VPANTSAGSGDTRFGQGNRQSTFSHIMGGRHQLFLGGLYAQILDTFFLVQI
jgi:hypothetical protein